MSIQIYDPYDNKPNNDPVPFDLPKNLRCPHCQKDLVCAFQATPNHSKQVRKDQIIVCSGCVKVLRVGDNNLVPVSKAEILQCSRDIQAKVMITCLTLKKAKEDEAKGMN